MWNTFCLRESGCVFPVGEGSSDFFVEDFGGQKVRVDIPESSFDELTGAALDLLHWACPVCLYVTQFWMGGWVAVAWFAWCLATSILVGKFSTWLLTGMLPFEYVAMGSDCKQKSKQLFYFLCLTTAGFFGSVYFRQFQSGQFRSADFSFWNAFGDSLVMSVETVTRCHSMLCGSLATILLQFGLLISTLFGSTLQLSGSFNMSPRNQQVHNNTQ